MNGFLLAILIGNSILNPQVALAKAMQGEEGGLLGDEAALAVGWAVRNRVEAGEGTYAEVVERYFFGAKRVEEPREKYLRLAQRILKAAKPLHPYKVVLSLQDMEKLGIREPPPLLYQRGPWGLAFWREWGDWR